MAELILWADICIGSGGVNTWERMYFGLPSIVFQLAENQKPICTYLKEMNLAEFIGDITNLDKNLFTNKLDSFVSNKNKLKKLSKENISIINSNGAVKITEAITRIVHDT